MATATVTSKGQITVPKAGAHKAWARSPGHRVEFISRLMTGFHSQAGDSRHPFTEREFCPNPGEP